MNILEKLSGKFPQDILCTHTDLGDLTACVKSQHILQILKFLKESPDLDFNVLMDLTAVDRHRQRPRYEVVYHLYSLKHNHRLRIKAPTDDPEPEVDSAAGLWQAADWYEREVWDMFGIRFKGHPDLSRILLYGSFKGHPLRKDYPVAKRQPLVGPHN